MSNHCYWSTDLWPYKSFHHSGVKNSFVLPLCQILVRGVLLPPLSILSVHRDLIQASTQKLYILDVSYFQGRSILHGACALSSYFDLQPCKYDLYRENLVWAITWKIKIATATYFQDTSTCHGTCALLGYFNLLTFDLDIMNITLKILMTFTIQILFGPIFRNYTWLHFPIFRAYQSIFTPQPKGPWGIAIIIISLSVCLSICPSTLSINTIYLHHIAGKRWYVTKLWPLGWPRSWLKGDALTDYNLETIYMEGQGHIFTIDLIFSGSTCHTRGPTLSEQYFIKSHNGTDIFARSRSEYCASPYKRLCFIIQGIWFTLRSDLICTFRK